jgi:hypothetical protein
MINTITNNKLLSITDNRSMIPFQENVLFLLSIIFLLLSSVENTIPPLSQESMTHHTKYTLDYISQFNDSGIRELFALFQDTRCQYRLDEHCEPGTVKIDPWLKHALKTQYFLSINDPINTIQLPGTHNSFNTRSNGYGGEDNVLRKVLRFFFKDTDLIIAQQEYSMTDQLNFGIRMLHLDSIWMLDKLVLCHGGTSFEWFDKLVKIVEEVFHIHIDYDSEQLGCTPFDRLWKDGIAEIATWVKNNTDEIVIVYINDYPHWDWGHQDELIAPIAEYMGDLVFTPKDKEFYFPDRNWPSIKQLLALKKRIILIGSNKYATVDGTWIHGPQWTDYPAKNANNFDGWPKCTRKDDPLPYNFLKDWNCVSGESNVFGPFYDGPSDMGLITPSNIQQFIDCGVKIIALDQASPKLVQNMIWTWAKGEPQYYKPCVYMQVESDPTDTNYKGTWYSETCDVKLPVACENKLTKGDWKIGNVTDLGPGKHITCPDNYQFSVPSNSYYAKLLKVEMSKQKVSQIWLNYHI